MSARTFAEWQAYSSLEPFGSYVEFWRAGMIASMIANVNRTKSQKAFTPEDFMPDGMAEKPTKQVDPDAIADRMKLYNEMQARHGKPNRT